MAATTSMRDWKEIAGEAAVETDNEKLMEKIRELCEAFDAQGQLKHTTTADWCM